MKANTSKLFNWFWEFSSAKDIARRISELDDESVLRLYDEEQDSKRGNSLKNPRQIQLALLKKKTETFNTK